MAKQKGTVKYDGTINGVNYYFRKGEPIARAAISILEALLKD